MLRSAWAFIDEVAKSRGRETISLCNLDILEILQILEIFPYAFYSCLILFSPSDFFKIDLSVVERLM